MESTQAQDELSEALIRSKDDTAEFAAVLSALTPDVSALLERCSPGSSQALLPAVWQEAFARRVTFDGRSATARAWVLAIARRHVMGEELDCRNCVGRMQPGQMPFGEWEAFAGSREAGAFAGDLRAVLEGSLPADRDLVILMSSLGITDEEASVVVGLNPREGPRHLFRIRTRLLAALAGTGAS